MVSLSKEYVPGPGVKFPGPGTYTIQNTITGFCVEIFSLTKQTALRIARDDLKIYKGDLDRNGKLLVVDYKPDEKTDKKRC